MEAFEIMGLAFTLGNSPYFLGGLLVLLILVLVLRGPVVRFVQNMRKHMHKRAKHREEKRMHSKSLAKHKEHDPRVKQEVVRVVKVTSNGAKTMQHMRRMIFLVLGLGVIVSAVMPYLHNWSFFSKYYSMFYDFIFRGANHNNLTSIIVAVLISLVLYLLIMAIEELYKSKKKAWQIMSYVLFFALLAFFLSVMINALSFTGTSVINAILIGIVFIVSGIFVSRKRRR